MTDLHFIFSLVYFIQKHFWILNEIEPIRIISARKADKNEQKQYIDRLGGN